MSPAQPATLQERLNLASDRQTSARDLVRLAADPDPEVRTRVAGNPATPRPTLVKLANDELVSIRRAVATNPTAPEDALTRLAGDSDPVTLERLLLRGRPNLINASLMETIASNPNIPLGALVEAANRIVPRDAINIREFSNYALFRRGPLAALRDSAENINTAPAALRAIAEHGVHILSELALSNPATSAETLLLFESDWQSGTAFALAIAGHTNSSAPLLERIAEGSKILSFRRTAQRTLRIKKSLPTEGGLVVIVRSTWRGAWYTVLGGGGKRERAMAERLDVVLYSFRGQPRLLGKWTRSVTPPQNLAPSAFGGGIAELALAASDLDALDQWLQQMVP